MTMPNEDDKTYPIQPRNEPDAPPPEEQKRHEEPDIEVSRGVEPLPIENFDFESLNLPKREDGPEEKHFEPEIEQDSDYIHSLDICPNCGKSMGSTRNLICVHCGFDLKTMKVIQTAKGEVTVEEVEQTATERWQATPICPPGLGDFITPGVMAAVGFGVLLIGLLAGASGLYPDPESGRVRGVLAEVVISGMWIAAAAAAVKVLSILLERPAGDLRLTFARAAGIVALMRLATFMNLLSNSWEWVLQSALQLPIAAGLSLVLYKIKPRDAAILLGLAIIGFLGVYFIARAISAVMG